MVLLHPIDPNRNRSRGSESQAEILISEIFINLAYKDTKKTR